MVYLISVLYCLLLILKTIEKNVILINDGGDGAGMGNWEGKIQRKLEEKNGVV